MRRAPTHSQSTILLWSISHVRLPTARVRSVREVHGIERAGLPLPLVVRDGECRRVGSDAVKETILEEEQVKRVSIPSELILDAGVEVDRTVGRVGSVKERRAVVEACGVCSNALEDAGTDMMSASDKHHRVRLGRRRPPNR
jgi:hypothetical protein